MKKILVPTDFSSLSTNALHFALEIAKVFQAELFLFHTYHIPVASVEPSVTLISSELDQLSKINKSQIKDVIESNKQLYTDVKITPIVKEGFLSDVMTDLIDEYKIELVIMGTEGASGIDKFLFGTNSASFVGTLDIPLLVIPYECSFMGIKNIVCATELNENEIQFILDGINFSKLFDAEFKLVHFANPTHSDFNNHLEKFKNFMNNHKEFKEYSKVSYDILANADYEEGIRDYLEETNTDILIVCTKKRNFFEKIFNRSHSKNLVLEIETPILVYSK